MPLEEQTYREGVMSRFDKLDKNIEKLDQKVSYTNGKVRKIILALVAISFLTMGLGVDKIAYILPLFGI